MVCSNNSYIKPQFNYEIMFGNTLHHQSSLYKSHLFKDFKYQLKYPICADYELNLKMFLTKEKSTYIQTPICYFRNGGKSSDPDNSLQARDEIDSIMKIYIIDNYHVHKKRVRYHFYIVIKVILKLREYLKIVKLRSI